MYCIHKLVYKHGYVNIVFIIIIIIINIIIIIIIINAKIKVVLSR